LNLAHTMQEQHGHNVYSDILSNNNQLKTDLQNEVSVISPYSNQQNVQPYLPLDH